MDKNKGTIGIQIKNFIAAVSKNPILYDTTLPGYKNAHKKKLAWQAIAKQVNGKDGSDMIWKWKNLRDSYAKHRKAITEPDTVQAHRFKNWRWGPYMTFLNPHLRKRREIMASVDTEESNNSLDSSSVVVDTKPSNAELSTSRKAYAKIMKCKCAENDNEQMQQESTSMERVDKIDYLFLNYAETFKKLSPRNQALLKLKMAEIFAEVELQEIEKDPIKIECSESVEDSE